MKTVCFARIAFKDLNAGEQTCRKELNLIINDSNMIKKCKAKTTKKNHNKPENLNMIILNDENEKSVAVKSLKTIDFHKAAG